MNTAAQRQRIVNVAFAYGVAATIWIASTDALVSYFVRDPSWLRWVHSIKGWVFVVVTSAMLWLVLRNLANQYDILVASERAAAERELRASEERYRMMFEANPFPMWLYDENSLRFLAVNEAAVRTYGYTKEEFLNKTILDIRDVDEKRKLTSYLPDASDVARRGVWRHQRKSSEAFDVEILSTSMVKGDACTRLVMARDVTEERLAAHALQSSKELLSDLTHRLMEHEQQASNSIAQALHDQLGQTLVVCKLLVETAGTEDDPALRANILKQAAQQLESSTNWVRQMLLELRPALLEDEGLLAALRSELNVVGIAARGLKFTLDSDGATSHLRWPDSVEYAAFMIVREALANAIQHAHASQAWVRIGGDDQSLIVEILDNGIGISADSAKGRPGHLGLTGMRERAHQLGADIYIGARDEGGTQIKFHWRDTENGHTLSGR